MGVQRKFEMGTQNIFVKNVDKNVGEYRGMEANGGKFQGERMDENDKYIKNFSCDQN